MGNRPDVTCGDAGDEGELARDFWMLSDELMRIAAPAGGKVGGNF